MKFIYHPDNRIYVNSDNYTYEDFISLNPDFPLVEGEYFSYINGEYNIINSQGHNLPQSNLEPFQNIITRIEAL